MIAGNWNKISSALPVLLVFLVFAKANDVALRNYGPPSINETASLESYIAQNDRQYLLQLDSYAAQIADFRAGYQRQLDTINYNKDFLEIRLSEVDQRLYPLEILNELTRNCVQRYSNIIVTVATVRSGFLSCINSAISYLSTILSSPESIQRVLNTYYNSNWKNGIKDCEKKHSASYTNHTICVSQVISTTNNYFNTNQRSFIAQMETSQCSANTRIRQTAECVFPTVNSTLTSIGEATRLIDDCISGIELCQQCNQQENNTIVIHESECPNVISIIPDSGTYTNTTIRNPFYGLNSSMKCILVNFLKPN